MKYQILKTKNEITRIIYDLKQKGAVVFGSDTMVKIVENYFDDSVSSYNAKFIHTSDEKDEALVCLIDFNALFYKQGTTKSAENILKHLGENSTGKIKTIGTSTYLVLACYICSKNTKDCFCQIIEKIKSVYKETHFVICDFDNENMIKDIAHDFHKYENESTICHIKSETDCLAIDFCNEDNKIYLAVPKSIDDLSFIGDNLKAETITIDNFCYSNKSPLCFEREEFTKCEIKAVEVSYDELLHYQRHINIFNLDEHFEKVDDKTLIIYTIDGELVQDGIYNTRLDEMVKTRENEWDLVADTILMYPISIDNIDKINNSPKQYNANMNAFMHYLDIRLQCETGVPYGSNGADMMKRFKSRIKRTYLGAVKCRITEEMIMDILDKEDVSVGADIYVHFIVAADAESNVGVLYIISLSSPFLLSHLLDNAVRNQLMVVNDDDNIENLYEYIRKRWDMTISGTPKSFVTIPKDKTVLDNQQLASLLMSETIYENGEEFSQIVDETILEAVESDHGVGQYDIAYVGVSLNTFIQFYPAYKGSVQYRFFWNSVTAFYIELVLFEEAAINRFIKELKGLMSIANKCRPEDFLQQNRLITNQYLATVDFWDVQLNYPSSQKSIRMIKEKFGNNDLMLRMQRYLDQTKNIFEINKELMDRNTENEEKKSNNTMNIILFVLTIVSTVSAIYQIVDYIIQYSSNNPIQNIYPLSATLISIIILVVTIIIRKNKDNKD